MTFRSKLLLASLPLALAPLAYFGLDARREVTRRFEAQYAERMDALAATIAKVLEVESASLAARLDGLVEAIASDSRLRVALLDPRGDDPEARAYLLDYAPRALPLSGLDVLRIQSSEGRVLSSGHFRNEYDASDAGLARTLARESEGAVLAELPTPAGEMLALVRGRGIRVGDESFMVVGGTTVDERFLNRLESGTGLEVALHTPGATAVDGSLSSDLVREVTIPFARGDDVGAARFVVRASDEPLALLRRDLDRRLLMTAVGAAALALLLAALVSAQLSRPLATLARRAGHIDLDRLDVEFPTRRLDEIGSLSRVLDRMTRRLRASAARIRDAERRATTGDIARQVHHDVRNGLIPIRNVLTHLTQVARETPEQMPGVFLERQGTLESSVTYLHSLATSYARLTPALERQPCDVNRIVRDVVGDAAVARTEEGVELRVDADLAPGLPHVLGDPVALRRVLDNLVVNAVESLEGTAGRVVVSTRLLEGGPARIRVVVADSGKGMTPEERARIFDDFYTTKPRGTGLGLSIVRRLVNDLGGRIEVESTAGEGARFTVELPAAGGSEAGHAASGSPPRPGTSERT